MYPETDLNRKETDKDMKKWIALWTSLLMMAMLSMPVLAEDAQTEAAAEVSSEETLDQDGEYEYEEVFADWNQEAPALQTLIEYVDTVTDESSEDYIPTIDRVAVFDMDGTVYAELFPTYLEYYTLAWRILKDPTIEPDAEMLAVGRTLRDCALDGSFPEDMPMQHAAQATRAYAGMTLNEFADYTTEILLRDADGFEGMTYGEAFYQPILEVIEYLCDNDFKVYIVSGSDRFLCRTLFEGYADIPAERFIGMDVGLEATGQHGTNGLDYVYTSNDDVIRTDKLLVKNLKMNKVSAIAQEIGRQPVISFGNSSGDVSMHMYTITNNPYKSAAFMLVADDDERDYGNPEKAAKLREQWEASGFNVISMKNDFRTIYGDDVVKTGTFRWAEELADNRGDGAEVFSSPTIGRLTAPESEDASAEDTQASSEANAQESAEESTDVQYVLYLGTNDKDTNEPVFDHDTCKKKAEDILINRFGGYTIQESDGGWIDDNGNVCEEYTLVIYLSDTDLDQVHAVSDELIKEFNQNTILIQANPTATEFYSGE